MGWGGGAGESPAQSAARRERNRGLAHPPRRPPLRSSCWPRRSASSRRGRLLTARPGRFLLRSRARGSSRQLQDSVPGQGRPWVHPKPGGDWRQSVSRGCGRQDQEAARGRRNSLLAAPALQQRWPRPPPPPQPAAAASSLFSPRAGALTELRRAPGGAFLLRHLLPLLLLQWRLHLLVVAASFPAPGLVALLRLAPRSRRRPEHRGLRRPPPGREAAAAGSREA